MRVGKKTLNLTLSSTRMPEADLFETLEIIYFANTAHKFYVTRLPRLPGGAEMKQRTPSYGGETALLLYITI